jgi:uncharacterized membrane protein
MPFDPLHPALVHVPLGLALIVPLVAAGLALAIRKAGSLVAAALGLWTGKAGGELVYRHGAARAYSGSSGSPALEALQAEAGRGKGLRRGD